MGHKNNPDPPKPPAPDITAARTPSPVETELQGQALRALQWGAAGDYRDPHAGGLFVNYSTPAMLHRNDELVTNAGAQGIEALGTPDPNYLATVRENRAAHANERNAGQYESDIREGLAGATGVAENMAGLSEAERMAILNSQTSSYNTQLAQPRQPRWWQYALSAAGPAMAAI